MGESFTNNATTAEGVFPSAPQAVTYTGFDKVSVVRQGKDSLCYTYGYDRQRILMEEQVGVTSRTKLYVGNCEFVTETDGNTTVEYSHTFLTGPYGVFAVAKRKNGNTELYYVLKDNLGSWTVVTGETDIVKQELGYDAWGNLRNPNTWATYTAADSFDKPVFDRGFTGHEHLYNFGLINMNGRMYDPVVSSFLSADRFVQNPMSAQGFNRYAYCMNNPLRFIDPTGWRAGGGNTGYLPNSSANAFDPYAFYGGHIPLEPRDLCLRQLPTSDPIIVWMEENSLYGGGGGGGVKPAGNAELEMIRNTLPKEAREFVQLDKNGFIDKELLNLYHGKSINFNNLKVFKKGNNNKHEKTMNIQINKHLFIVILLFANMKAIGQIKVDTAKSCYYNDFLKETQLVEDITITNNSEEEYLTWIARSPAVGKPNSVLINRFFFSRNGDFRLFDLMYDNIYYEIKFNIPCTFIKKIPQGESFTYVILKENEKTDFYSKRIVIISRKEVEDYIGQSIREEFFFPMSRICLSEKNDL